MQNQLKGNLILGTIIPFGNVEWYSDEKEQVRQEVNNWIRVNQIFDGIFDFDRVLADPHTPSRLLPKYDFGDHLHLNNAGNKALADSISLSLFEKQTKMMNTKRLLNTTMNY